MHLLRAVAGRDAGPGRGVGVHPLAGRGARQQPEEHVEVLPGRHHLLDADHRDQHLGQGQAHPAVALGLDDHQRAGLGDREVGAGDGDPGAQELLPQVQPRGPGQLGRVVGEVVGRGPSGTGHPLAGRSRRISARLRWIAGTRMWRGRSSPSCTISSARSVSQAAMPCLGQRLVEPDLLGGHRLDLDHLVDAVGLRDRGDDRVGLGRVAGPVHGGTAAVSAASSWSRCSSRSRSVRSLIAAPGRAAAPPSPRPRRPRAPACRGWCAVACARLCRSWVSASAARAAVGNARHPDEGVAAQCRMLAAGSSVRRAPRPGASTRTPARCRDSSPPMCIRHELSPADQHLGAGLADVAGLVGAHRDRRVGVLHRERAAEAAALRRPPGRSTRRQPPHLLEQPTRPVADAEHPQRVAGRVVGDACAGRTPRRRSPRARRRGTRSARRPSAPVSRHRRGQRGVARALGDDPRAGGGPSPRTSPTASRSRRTPRTRRRRSRTTGTASSR